jgi:hypothetical protein
MASKAGRCQVMPAAVSLIEPIFNAQLEPVRRSRVIAMDETPISPALPALQARIFI